MATKYRQDLTDIDFRILKRFKYYLLKKGISHPFCYGGFTQPDIRLRTSIEIVFVQRWYLSGSGWQESDRKQCKCPCYILNVRDFRSIIRCIAQDIPKITEGLVLHVLRKFSILLYDENGQWKRQNIGGHEIWLEQRRLSPEGQIKKRNPEAAAAKLDLIRQHIRGVQDYHGVDYTTAVNMLSTLGVVTSEIITKLELEVQGNATRKEHIRADIDERIRRQR